ncbi:MAG: DUF2461 domain-containing protein [Bacteroidota bacterium]|nr:DUF2461 domain-containing protein [Bacteroidota bacterium]MDP4244789.1 DUF2461 domain-containing protein [Bacteroidota bacterium]
MSPITIRQGSLDFLKRLARNNNRDWFNKNKDKYLEARDNLIAFADALLFEMNKHDRIETLSGKDSLYRIYKDVRFSKDKTPYNTHWSAAFKRATQKLRGGYYFKIKPGGSGLVGGFWGPGPQDLKRIRQDIDINYHDWRKMLNGKKLVTAFGGIFGEQVGSAPRGYTRDHPAIDLLRYKQFLLRREFTDAEVCSRRFLYEVNDSFKQMRPFLNYMSEVLTTDANGESLI